MTLRNLPHIPKAMSEERTQVLNPTQVKQKIDRIAFEIFEHHHDEATLIVAGIAGNGMRLAELLADRLRELSAKEIRLVEVSIDKHDPLSTTAFVNIEKEEAEGRVVILVDDVLNSGRTLMYGVIHLLKVRLKALRTAILIERSHKQFPVRADFVGLALSTTLQEHVKVELTEPMGAYLE